MIYVKGMTLSTRRHVLLNLLQDLVRTPCIIQVYLCSYDIKKNNYGEGVLYIVKCNENACLIARMPKKLITRNTSNYLLWKGKYNQILDELNKHKGNSYGHNILINFVLTSVSSIECDCIKNAFLAIPFLDENVKKSVAYSLNVLKKRKKYNAWFDTKQLILPGFEVYIYKG